MKDPEDDRACVVNPCGNLPDATSACVPNLGMKTFRFVQMMGYNLLILLTILNGLEC